MQLYYGKSKIRNVDGSICDMYLNENREFNRSDRRSAFLLQEQAGMRAPSKLALQWVAITRRAKY